MYKTALCQPMVTWKPFNLQRTFYKLLPLSQSRSKIKSKVKSLLSRSKLCKNFLRPGPPWVLVYLIGSSKNESWPLRFSPHGVSISAPCLSVSADKGALWTCARWMLLPSCSLGKCFSHSSPVIAGMHGRGAGIGTVHKVINNNPHDRWGPLKVPVMQ